MPWLRVACASSSNPTPSLRERGAAGGSATRRSDRTSPHASGWRTTRDAGLPGPQGSSRPSDGGHGTTLVATVACAPWRSGNGWIVVARRAHRSRVVVALTLAGAGLWYLRSLPKPVEIAAGASPAGGVGRLRAPGSARRPRPHRCPLIVDITGSVRQPGVYEFAQGDRVDRRGRAGRRRQAQRRSHRPSTSRRCSPTAPRSSCRRQGAVAAVGATGSGDTGSASGSTLQHQHGDGHRFRDRCRGSARCWRRRSSTTAPRTARSSRSTTSKTSAGSVRPRSRRSATRSPYDRVAPAGRGRLRSGRGCCSGRRSPPGSVPGWRLRSGARR